jgi:hypothetical protein
MDSYQLVSVDNSPIVVGIGPDKLLFEKYLCALGRHEPSDTE